MAIIYIAIATVLNSLLAYMTVKDVSKMEKFLKVLQMEVFNPDHVSYPLKAESLKEKINILGRRLDKSESALLEDYTKFVKLAEYLDIMFAEPHYKKINKK